MSIVNLSALPAPQVLEDLDFEDISRLTWRPSGRTWATAGPRNWKSDPVTKLLEVGAYRTLLNRARVNDAAKALLLAYAKRQ